MRDGKTGRVPHLLHDGAMEQSWRKHGRRVRVLFLDRMAVGACPAVFGLRSSESVFRDRLGRMGCSRYGDGLVGGDGLWLERTERYHLGSQDEEIVLAHETNDGRIAEDEARAGEIDRDAAVEHDGNREQVAREVRDVEHVAEQEGSGRSSRVADIDWDVALAAHEQLSARGAVDPLELGRAQRLECAEMAAHVHGAARVQEPFVRGGGALCGRLVAVTRAVDVAAAGDGRI